MTETASPIGSPPAAGATGTPPPPANMLAALTAVLHRRTGQDAVAVACRIADGGELRVGTVVADLSDDPTFATLVARSARVCADLTDTTSAAPDAASEAQGGADVAAHFVVGDIEVPLPSGVPVVSARPGSELTVTGDAGSTDGRELADLAAQVRAAGAAGDREPHRRISVLRLTTDADLELLHRFGGTGRAPAEARCIHELVAGWAAEAPDASAVDCGGEVLSYRALDERARWLAAALVAAGVRPDAVVGVLLPRSAELVVALLAIMKAGGAYLALEPDDPASRHERLLVDAGVRVLVTDDPASAPCDAIVTVGTAAQGVDRPLPPEEVPANPDRLAYVSYTSGSTGEPKGVGVPHRAISRLVREANWMEVRPDDVFFEVAPVAFDASTWELWAPLVHGCRLVVFPSGTVELEEVARRVQDRGVTVLLLTTGLFHQMVASHLEMFGGLRHVITGGDVASPEHVQQLMKTHPHLRFTNGYGPTENTTFTTCWTSESPPERGPVPIGRAISGTRVLVLDPELKPVPVGVCGELYAAGEGLARGYLGRPDATAERFLPDPSGAVPGARMYRTGDLVRWRADGALEFVGRIDQQVKIQGYRIEPGAVEAELERHPEVRHAVIVAQQQKTGKRLLAYVVPTDPDTGDGLGRRLREYLHGTLPPYSVPWAILPCDSLPLNRNGKLDRRALPVASRVPRNVSNNYLEPRTRAEARLAFFWGEVLGVEPIGVEDDFFDLGGHSLLAAELLGRLRKELSITVSARTLYLQPTVAELAAELDASLDANRAGRGASA